MIPTHSLWNISSDERRLKLKQNPHFVRTSVSDGAKWFFQDDSSIFIRKINFLVSILKVFKKFVDLLDLLPKLSSYKIWTIFKISKLKSWENCSKMNCFCPKMKLCPRKKFGLRRKVSNWDKKLFSRFYAHVFFQIS